MAHEFLHTEVKFLHLFSYKGYYNIVEAMMLSKVDPNMRNKYGTPLHYAVAGYLSIDRHQHVAGHGMMAGAAAQTEQGQASANGGLDTVRTLLEYGADPGVANEAGKTPLDYAEESGDGDLIAALNR